MKEVPGYEGKFMATEDGRIYSIARKNGRGVAKGGFRKLQKHPQGYLFINAGDRQQLVHRLIAMAFIPNPEGKEFVNHINGIKTDNRVENLEWVTRQENENHAYGTGLKNSTGSSNTMAVLNEAKVKQIKELNTLGFNTAKIATQFGVTGSTISRIIKGKIWKHVN
jgi:predicted XRE-type DNA-binding protein